MAASSNGDASTDKKMSTDFACSLETKSLQMQQGDVLFLFTDGVSESVNADGKEYGQERIAGLIKTFNSETVEKLRDLINNELIRFRAGTDLRDDTTFVLLKRS
jgi:sigma-B regulation protein RsbU (phosphoserine phosphatase)